MPGGRPGGWGGGSGAWPRRFRDRGRRAPFLPLFKVLGRGKPQPSLPGASTGLRWGFLRGGGARGSLPSETGLGGEAGAAPPHRRRAPARRLIPPPGGGLVAGRGGAKRWRAGVVAGRARASARLPWAGRALPEGPGSGRSSLPKGREAGEAAGAGGAGWLPGPAAGGAEKVLSSRRGLAEGGGGLANPAALGHARWPRGAPRRGLGRYGAAKALLFACPSLRRRSLPAANVVEWGLVTRRDFWWGGGTGIATSWPGSSLYEIL